MLLNISRPTFKSSFTAAMFIASLLFLSGASVPVYAEKTSTVNIAKNSVQECLRRYCVKVVGNTSIPGIITTQEFVNSCIENGKTGKFLQGHNYPPEVYQALCGGTSDTFVGIDPAVENEKETPKVSLNQKNIFPRKKPESYSPRYGFGNAIGRLVFYWDDVGKRIENADGFFSAYAAYLEGVFGTGPVFYYGLVEDKVRQHTPLLEKTRDSAFEWASVFYGIGTGIGAFNAIKAAGGIEAIPSLIREEYKIIASIFGKNVDDVGSVVVKWRAPKNVTEKFPAEWGSKANKKGVGTRWQDPKNPGNGVRIDQGNPKHSLPSQQVDHVIVRRNGQVIGRDGNPIQSSIKDSAEQTHIPLSEYQNWKSWDSPL
ncbi:MAG: hypothetical protein KDC80_23670 [Saprospiraceae bacterium]|nr:hypothetical protein [Saprospiraceae bacterium]